MKKNYVKYIESFLFILISGVLLKLKLSDENSYLVDFSLGNFFYLTTFYLFLRILIPFLQNKILKNILKTRLNGFYILILCTVNIVLLLSVKNHSYEEFFSLSLETFKTGGIFVSLFGQIYKYIPHTALLVSYSLISVYLVLYVFGKLFGFIVREREKRKSGEFYINKQKRKDEKIRLKRAKKEEKNIKKREGLKEAKLEQSNLKNSEKQEDFLDDIKKEFQTLIHHKDKSDIREKNDDEKRKKIEIEIKKRQELKKGSKENEDEKTEKTEIIFLKDESIVQEKLFDEANSPEDSSLKNYEQKTLFYSDEYVELAKTLNISLELLQKAIELVHKQGIRGSGFLEKELNVDSDEAERIYRRVKKMKEY